MDNTNMLQLVALTIAVMEGIKQFKIKDEWKTVITVFVGGFLAGIAEFAPDAWIRILPILTVGLAAAGLYSLGKRSGIAVINNK